MVVVRIRRFRFRRAGLRERYPAPCPVFFLVLGYLFRLRRDSDRCGFAGHRRIDPPVPRQFFPSDKEGGIRSKPPKEHVPMAWGPEPREGGILRRTRLAYRGGIEALVRFLIRRSGDRSERHLKRNIEKILLFPKFLGRSFQIREFSFGPRLARNLRQISELGFHLRHHYQMRWAEKNQHRRSIGMARGGYVGIFRHRQFQVIPLGRGFEEVV